MTQPFVSD